MREYICNTTHSVMTENSTRERNRMASIDSRQTVFAAWHEGMP